MVDTLVLEASGESRESSSLSWGTNQSTKEKNGRSYYSYCCRSDDYNQFAVWSRSKSFVLRSMVLGASGICRIELATIRYYNLLPNGHHPP